MTSPIRATRAAIVFLTRVPVGGFPYSPDEWRWAPAYFPLVGAVLGAVLAALLTALRPLGSFAAATLTLGVSLLLTGAFHEDGLADTSDALGGAFDRPKVFLILKDSRVGTFGACAVVITIVGRAALLARLGDDAAWSLVVVGAIARAGPIWQMAALPYATEEGAKSRSVARAGWVQAAIASLWPSLAIVALVAMERLEPGRAAALVVACVVVTAITAYRYWRRVGGVTGDFLGATEQLCELASLGVLAWGVE